MQCEQQTVAKLSNGTIFNDIDLEWKVTPLLDAEYLRNGTRCRQLQ